MGEESRQAQPEAVSPTPEPQQASVFGAYAQPISPVKGPDPAVVAGHALTERGVAQQVARFGITAAYVGATAASAFDDVGKGQYHSAFRDSAATAAAFTVPWANSPWKVPFNVLKAVSRANGVGLAVTAAPFAIEAAKEGMEQAGEAIEEAMHEEAKQKGIRGDGIGSDTEQRWWDSILHSVGMPGGFVMGEAEHVPDGEIVAPGGTPADATKLARTQQQRGSSRA